MTNGTLTEQKQLEPGQQADSPPYSNTGAVTAIVDWLAWTVPGLDPWEMVDLFEAADWDHVPRGGFGYRQQLVCGKIQVFYDGNDDMGVLVTLSGGACRQLERMPCFSNWPALLQKLQSLGARLTRLDLAFDDHEGLLDMDRMISHMHKNAFTSRSRRWDLLESHTGDKNTGKTIYIGAPSSRARLRIYDKAVEREEDRHWIRVELQLRKKRAQEIMEIIIARNGDLEVALGVIKNYLLFRELGANQERYRQPVCGWWDAFLGKAEVLRLSTGAPEKDIDDVRQWVDRQVAPSLALVVAKDGGSLDWLMERVSDGRKRWRGHHKRMLKNERS